MKKLTPIEIFEICFKDNPIYPRCPYPRKKVKGVTVK